MRVRSFLAVVGLFGFAAIGCGGSGASGITLGGGQSRDLGGFLVPSQGGNGPDGSSSSGGNKDMMSSGGGCTNISSCSGNTLTYCDPTTGSNQTVDCTAQGLVCGIDTAGLSDCVSGSTSGGNDAGSTSGGNDAGSSSGSCGSIDSNGICNGNTLEYCSNTTHKLVTKDCTASTTTTMCVVVTKNGAPYAECM